MTRADLLKDAILDGLHKIDRKKDFIDMVEAANFQEDEFGRVVAFAPRQRLQPKAPASQYVVLCLRDSIEEGLRVHGFADPIIIEP